MSTDFTQIPRSTNLCDDVAARIKEAIISGQVTPGDPLPGEIELASQFGVSRPVVREALKTLQSTGFIEIRRGTKGGAFVTDLSRLNLVDNLTDLVRLRRMTVDHMFQARMHLEPEMMRLAVERISEEEIEKLTELVAESETTTDDYRRIEVNSEFHRIIGRACGNPFYALLMESFMDFARSFRLTVEPLSHNIHRRGDHGEIVAAMAERNAEKAAALAMDHLLYMHKKMKEFEDIYLDKAGVAENGSPKAADRKSQAV